MNAIYLEANKIPAHLRAGYTGQKFKAEACEVVHIHADAGVWSGGSRETYRHIRLSDGRTVEAVNHSAAPWDSTRHDVEIKLQPGFAVIKHSMFCGKDMGLTFFLHPENIAALLPAPSASISDTAHKVLNIIAGYKSAYRADYYRRENITPDQVEAAKAELLAVGFIAKNGAITPAGRNARVRS